MSKSPHRIGSMLTFICITLTFSLLTLILGTGGGITKEIDTAIEDMPGDVLEVYLSIGKSGSSGHQFPIEELERLETLVPSAEAIAAEAHRVGYLEHRVQEITREGKGYNYPISITPGCIGVTANYFSVRGIKIAQGRAFTSLEEESGANVAVAAIDPTALGWGSGTPQVGSLVKDLLDRKFEIVGICNAGENTGVKHGFMYVPLIYTYDADSIAVLLEKKFPWAYPGGGGSFTASVPVWRPGDVSGVSFWVKPKPGLMSRTIEELEEALSHYNVGNITVTISSEGYARNIAYKVKESIGRNLFAASAIVLCIAAINCANLLLFTVIMESRDIGVRRAVGATEMDIANGVVGGALRLSIVGIGVGLGLAFSVRGIFENFLGESVVISYVTIVEAAGILCACMIAASFYPAIRAAKIPPVEALRGIRPRNRKKKIPLDVRQVLSVAAVAVGIAGVLLLAGTGYITRQSVKMYMAAAGENWVIVEMPDIFEQREGVPLTLTPDIAQSVSTCEDVSKAGWFKVTTTACKRVGSSELHLENLLICNPEYMDLKMFEAEKGRLFGHEDDGKAVCVIGSKVWNEMFMGEDPVGQYIQISDETQFQVIGVLEPTPKGLMDLEGDRDRSVFLLPGSASLIRDISPTVYDEAHILAGAKEGVGSGALINSLESYFSANFPDYQIPKVRQYAEGLEALSTVRAKLDRAYGVIGVLALIMAGIGVNNLMMVVVAERTSEIGIRRALGATRQDVMRLFLRQSLNICLLGTCIGFLLAIPSLVAIDRGVTLTVGTMLRFALTAGAMGILTGILGGFYSARSASLKQPVEAIRYE